MTLLRVLLALLGIPAFYGIRQLMKEKQRKQKEMVSRGLNPLMLKNKQRMQLHRRPALLASAHEYVL